MEEIELKINNLYRTGYVERNEYGEEIMLRTPVKFENHITNKYHTVTQYDRLDLLAYQYYKDEVADSSKFWWILADVNEIIDPFDLSPYLGKRLVIPDISRILITL